MNYRHGFHAGNFADVLKHAVLARVLLHLRSKERPFRVIDTHAGRGSYDLHNEEALRTGEWRYGIGRLTDAEREPLQRELVDFLAPYLEAVSAWRTQHGAFSYPGSPAIVRHFLRPHDRLLAVELEERAFLKLGRLFPPGSRVKALRLDGYEAWKAFIPPKERRGLVIVDPPYEAPDEFGRVANGLEAAVKKWATGMTLLWYPVKDRVLVENFVARSKGHLPVERLRIELDTGAAQDEPGLSACGLIIVNPPWTLARELEGALPLLARRLSRGSHPRASCQRL
ncbi:MAG: 23S rRNA (adenine(2030)-N(6))-methyltransferase RlmJ [Hyphomicrobiales bacterium]|nr:23S rRNA (adenine(2030)-N(6))-methyltransferase RlmJ [Hyphomicrobiales bacterium]MBV9114875.1 23S rRNA (adenine(2030)-N(6))-methyltransferase RlmJ [Hyphomicrobiales bacterium]MBV9521029.1 23S rRNA (adenine(2030)-N(6))-methyltransferase RlmJ [Hyphomicrobiales bacterium]